MLCGIDLPKFKSGFIDVYETYQKLNSKSIEPQMIPDTLNIHPVHTTFLVDKDWGLKQTEADSSQTVLSFHTTEFNLD